MDASSGHPVLDTEGGHAPVRRGASRSGLPRVPFRRHDLAAVILNPVLGARRKLFEGPADRRGLLHGGPKPTLMSPTAKSPRVAVTDISAK